MAISVVNGANISSISEDEIGALAERAKNETIFNPDFKLVNDQELNEFLGVLSSTRSADKEKVMTLMYKVGVGVRLGDRSFFTDELVKLNNLTRTDQIQRRFSIKEREEDSVSQVCMRQRVKSFLFIGDDMFSETCFTQHRADIPDT